MAERDADNHEGAGQPELAEHSQLERALHAVAGLLRFDDEQIQALHSHFLPDRPDVGLKARVQVVGRVNLLVQDYFANNKALLTTPAWNDAQRRHIDGLRRQQSIMRLLMGSSKDGLMPRRMDDILGARPPKMREMLYELETDALVGTVKEHDRRRRAMQALFVGKKSAEQVIEPPVAEIAIAEEVAEAPADEEDDDAAWEGVETEIRGTGNFALQRERRPRHRWDIVKGLSEKLGVLDEESDDPDRRIATYFKLAGNYDNSATAYLSILEHPSLTKDEIKTLYDRMNEGRTALHEMLYSKPDATALDALARLAVLGYRARNTLVEHHLRYAKSLAMRLGSSKLDDALQSANIGLVQAVDAYDAYHTAKLEGRELSDDEEPQSLTNIATYHIIGAILRTMQKEARAEFARTMSGRDVIGGISEEDRHLLIRVHEEAWRHGHKATFDEVGEWLGFSHYKVERLLARKTTTRAISIEQHADNKESSLHPSVMSALLDDSASHFETVGTLELRTAFWEAIRERLPARQHQVLVMCYAYSMTHQEVADQLGITRQAVDQIHDRGIANLRKVLNAKVEEQPKRQIELDGPSELLAKVGIEMPGADIETKREKAIQLVGAFAMTAQEGMAVSLRYGLGHPKGEMLRHRDVGEKLELEREQVRYVDKKVLDKIRRHVAEQG